MLNYHWIQNSRVFTCLSNLLILHPHIYMDLILVELTKDFDIGSDLRESVTAFLVHHQCPDAARHCADVGAIATDLAVRFGLDAAAAQQAGWLHDVSAVFPKGERLAAARALDIDILPEEEKVPLLLHQKLSAVIAREIFNVADAGVLNAVGCHTTLKPNPSSLDLVLFVADKLGWDQRGDPPYKHTLESALETSLEEAAWAYQDYLWHSGKMKVPHPWMRESYIELSKNLKKSHEF
jgi:predicted HD superfamily hydrolase involved in NAD metabolism